MKLKIKLDALKLEKIVKEAELSMMFVIQKMSFIVSVLLSHGEILLCQ